MKMRKVKVHVKFEGFVEVEVPAKDSRGLPWDDSLLWDLAGTVALANLLATVDMEFERPAREPFLEAWCPGPQDRLEFERLWENVSLLKVEGEWTNPLIEPLDA